MSGLPAADWAAPLLGMGAMGDSDAASVHWEPLSFADIDSLESWAQLHETYPLDPSGKLSHNYGTIHHFQRVFITQISMAIFQFANGNSHYQRVNLHFPMVFPWFSHGFPIATMTSSRQAGRFTERSSRGSVVRGWPRRNGFLRNLTWPRGPGVHVIVRLDIWYILIYDIWYMIYDMIYDCLLKG